MNKIAKLGMILAIFCVVSAGGLAYVYLLTQPMIEKNSKLAMENSRREVLAGRKGTAVSISARGYGGPIDMMVGVGTDGKGLKVIKVKVLNHRETPGLGANIVNEGFLKQFAGKKLDDPIEPHKDIDAITGATISSRAVCGGVRRALEKAGESK